VVTYKSEISEAQNRNSIKRYERTVASVVRFGSVRILGVDGFFYLYCIYTFVNKSKCLPVLLYGLEACPLTKSNL